MTIKVYNNGQFKPLEGRKVYHNGAWRIIKGDDLFRWQDKWWLVNGIPEMQRQLDVIDTSRYNNGYTETPVYWWELNTVRLPPESLRYTRINGNMLERGGVSNENEAIISFETTYVLPRVQSYIDQNEGYYEISGINIWMEVLSLAPISISLDSSTTISAKNRTINNMLVDGERLDFVLPFDGAEHELWNRRTNYCRPYFGGHNYNEHKQVIIGQVTTNSFNITFMSFSHGENDDKAWAKLHSSRIATIKYNYIH